MPDWVMNEITISGKDSHVDTLVNAVSNPQEDLVLDFNQIIPIPSWIQEKNWAGSSGLEPFDWRETHWGTSRNAVVIDWKRDLDSAEYKIHTAWTAPENIAKELRSLFPELRISWGYRRQNDANTIEI